MAEALSALLATPGVIVACGERASMQGGLGPPVTRGKSFRKKRAAILCHWSASCLLS
jgi:hypothetical protein